MVLESEGIEVEANGALIAADGDDADDSPPLTVIVVAAVVRSSTDCRRARHEAVLTALCTASLILANNRKGSIGARALMAVFMAHTGTS